MLIESVMLSNHLILYHPLLLFPSIFPSISVFSNESVLWIRCPKYWSFSFSIQFSSVQSLNHVQLFATPWIAALQASLSITNSRSLLKFIPSSRWCHPAISSSVVPFSPLPPVPPSIRVFSNESTLCMRWPKYWSFSFSISPSNEHPPPSNEYSRLISCKID